MINKNDLTITTLVQLQNQKKLIGVGGDLVIDIGQTFCMDDQFPCLEFVSGNIELNDTGVVTVNDFHRLTRVGKDIIFRNNNKLACINGFECLEFVRDLEFGGGDDNGNPLLENVSGFDNLTTIGDDLIIVSNPKLCHLPNFGKLTKINGDLCIESNSSLECIDAFHNLLVIVDEIDIIANPSLVKISGFESLIAIQEIVVKENGLKCLPNFESLKWLGRQEEEADFGLASLIIEQNHRLSDIPSEFMPCLLSAKGAIQIVNNSKLRSISGFQSMGVSRQLLIQNNCGLVEICGFDSLELTNPFEISGNKRLHRICGFNNLVSIRQGESDAVFKINASDDFTQNVQSICGFKRLIAVNGKLYPETNQMSVFLRGKEYTDVPSFLIAIQKQCGHHC